MDNLVPIGRFSKICRLSISALRYYDEQGLLRPAVVDPDSSYRYYRLSQVRVAETIRLLRALEMPLEDVHRYLREHDQDAIKQLLNRHQRRLEERLEEDQRILSYLRRLQGDEYPASSAVRARTLDPQRIVCIRVCVPEQEVSGTWRSLATEIRGVLSRYDREPAGPIGAIFPDPVHRDDAVNMTVFAPIVGEISLQGRMHEERIAGGLAATILHLGPYTLLHRSYEQLVGWMQHHGHEMAGPPREIFRIGPIEVDDPNSYETEVVWPVQ